MHFLSGSEPMPALNGGYLYIYSNDKLLKIVGIPSPNITADNYKESLITDDETFLDEDGNEYNVEIFSSKYGVDWEISSNKELNDINVKVKYNEF